jgi:hypothetical protein
MNDHSALFLEELYVLSETKSAFDGSVELQISAKCIAKHSSYEETFSDIRDLEVKKIIESNAR